jgi:chemotaxis protein MotA
VLIVIGFIIVAFSVFGGYAVSGGALGPLWQPSEVLIIGGAAIGAFIASNNMKTMKGVLRAASRLRITTKYTKATYIEVLVLLYSLLSASKRGGMKAIEADIENPLESKIFERFPAVLEDKRLLTFICDYMRIMVSGNISPHELDELMTHEIEELEHDLSLASDALNKMSDGLPAFGIVAAVMGVVKALTAADASPAEIGEMIAHALVGTFLGILLAYGFVGPLANRIERQVAEAVKLHQCVRIILITSLHGYQPQIAVEFGRKALHADERPEAIELEEIMRESKKAGAA